MLSFRPGTRIFISTEPTDMRKGFNGLSAIVEHAWSDNPLSGDLFVFANRRQTLLKSNRPVKRVAKRWTRAG